MLSFPLFPEVFWGDRYECERFFYNATFWGMDDDDDLCIFFVGSALNV